MTGGGAAYSQVPVTLRRVIDPQRLRQHNPCDRLIILGSFWPNSRTSFESHIAKGFKECCPIDRFQPHITSLCRFYSSLICKAIDNEPISAITRVLSSAEREPEPNRPQGLLVNILCEELGAQDASPVFFKSESRPSMRNIKRLSGPDALSERIQYLVQDLFLRPQELGGTVLLIDDIYNTGASVRAYAWALKEYAGVERVISINLAATRFGGGRDGHGMLKLDISPLNDYESLDQVWLDADGSYHITTDCSIIAPPITAQMSFIAEGKGKPCPNCIPKPTRKWWQMFKPGK